ncbi:hypothetical protein ACFPRL_20445 [Pseudoclavibacter helvolus]
MSSASKTARMRPSRVSWRAIAASQVSSHSSWRRARVAASSASLLA